MMWAAMQLLAAAIWGAVAGMWITFFIERHRAAQTTRALVAALDDLNAELLPGFLQVRAAAEAGDTLRAAAADVRRLASHRAGEGIDCPICNRTPGSLS